MWTTTGAPPIEMTSLQLDINNRTEVAVIEATMTEKNVTTLDKPSSRCKPYTSSEFTSCSKNFILARIKNEINCTLPGECCF